MANSPEELSENVPVMLVRTGAYIMVPRAVVWGKVTDVGKALISGPFPKYRKDICNLCC